MDLDLSDYFGDGASQTATTLTIQKASLPDFTPATTNSAQSILAAILLQVLLLSESYFTYEGQAIAYEDEQIIPLSDVLNASCNVSLWKRFFYGKNTYYTLLFTALYEGENLTIMPTQIPVNVNLSGLTDPIVNAAIAAQKGAANGIASLGSDGRLPISQLASVLQVSRYEGGAVLTGTTTIPYDDTLPQNTEGFQIFTLDVTPKSATSKLHIKGLINVSHTASSVLIASLFRDSGVNAIDSGLIYPFSGNVPGQIVLSVIVDSNSMSTQTFKVRAGSASAGTLTINGLNGARRLGGILISWLEIMEVLNG